MASPVPVVSRSIIATTSTLLTRLQYALDRMQPFDRDVVTAVYFTPLTQADVAKRMGVSPLDVRGAMRRAFQAIANAVETGEVH